MTRTLSQARPAAINVAVSPLKLSETDVDSSADELPQNVSLHTLPAEQRDDEKAAALFAAASERVSEKERDAALLRSSSNGIGAVGDQKKSIFATVRSLGRKAGRDVITQPPAIATNAGLLSFYRSSFCLRLDCYCCCPWWSDVVVVDDDDCDDGDVMALAGEPR
jgi:hypothetical protein